MSEEKLIELSENLIYIIMSLLDDIEDGKAVSEARKELLEVKELIPQLIKNAGM